MARDAVLNLTITKTLKEALYATAKENRRRIGDFVDLILFDAIKRYENNPVEFNTSEHYTDLYRKENVNFRCESQLKQMLLKYSKRDTGDDMSVAFQMIAANYLSEKRCQN